MKRHPQIEAVIRWLYDHTVAVLSLWLWSRFTCVRWRLEFCKAITHAVTPSGRGLSKNLELGRLDKRGLISGRSVLLIGVGNGTEVLQWLSFAPKILWALDLEDHREEWSHRMHPRDSHHLHFAQADATRLPFGDGSIDLVASFTVLEHIVALEEHIQEAWRVLRRDGRMYAVFGPLWPCFDGSHIGSAGYQHLLCPSEDLPKLAEHTPGEESKWLRRGMFNRYRYQKYREIFGAFFSVEYEAWVLSREGLAFRTQQPQLWQTLRRQYTEQDLLLKDVFLLLKRKSRPTQQSPNTPVV